MLSCKNDEELTIPEQENKILVFNSSSSFQRIIGLEGVATEFRSIKEVDQGYIVVGYDSNHAIVHELDINGQVSQKLGNSIYRGIYFLQDVKIASDGGLLMPGHSGVHRLNKYGFWSGSLSLAKTGPDGSHDWSYSLTRGISANTYLNRFVECEVTSDGIWIAGKILSQGVGGQLIKVDINGNLIKQAGRHGDANDIHVINGNELVSCNGNPYYNVPNPEFDLYFMDNMGDSIRMVAKLDESIWNSIEVTASRIFVGGAKNGIGVVRAYDHTGDVLWNKELDIENISNVLDIKETHDGNLILSATKGLNAKILKLNISSQQAEWIREFNGGHQTMLYEVQPTSDGGYVAAGYSQYGLNKFGYLVKIDANGN